MEFNKKAISPVVATALLLVVAVVAVVGFQTWFNTYQSGIQSKVEKQSNAGPPITIEMLQWKNTTSAYVYLKNIDTKNISISSLKVGNCTNSVPGNAINGTVTKFNVSSCTAPVFSKGDSYNIITVSITGVISGTKILR